MPCVGFDVSLTSKPSSRRIEKVCVAVPVSQVAELTMESYQPGASTPLIDAAYKTIKAVEKSLNGSNPKVVVCIQTDGHENASTEHTPRRQAPARRVPRRVGPHPK